MPETAKSGIPKRKGEKWTSVSSHKAGQTELLFLSHPFLWRFSLTFHQSPTGCRSGNYKFNFVKNHTWTLTNSLVAPYHGTENWRMLSDSRWNILNTQEESFGDDHDLVNFCTDLLTFSSFALIPPSKLCALPQLNEQETRFQVRFTLFADLRHQTRS